jgi:hypothetical protein
VDDRINALIAPARIDFLFKRFFMIFSPVRF